MRLARTRPLLRVRLRRIKECGDGSRHRAKVSRRVNNYLVVGHLVASDPERTVVPQSRMHRQHCLELISPPPALPPELFAGLLTKVHATIGIAIWRRATVVWDVEREAAARIACRWGTVRNEAR
jgi:hypothetical protein